MLRDSSANRSTPNHERTLSSALPGWVPIVRAVRDEEAARPLCNGGGWMTLACVGTQLTNSGSGHGSSVLTKGGPLLSGRVGPVNSSDASSPYAHFPTPSLSRFRERLFLKRRRAELDPSFVSDRLEYVSEKLTEEILSSVELASRCPVPDTVIETSVGLVGVVPVENCWGEVPVPPAGTLSTKENTCGRQVENRRKAKKIVKLLRMDQSLHPTRGVPTGICCGDLRTVVRSIYPSSLNPTQELSIKTSAKAEGRPCRFCLDLKTKEHLVAFKRSRLSPVDEPSQAHLDSFARAFSGNVPNGWNKRKVPYIPNGNASSGHTRREGGNWNSEGFSADCRTELVFSSGKPRVVTLYSSHNVEVLTPLHHSLYSFLKGRGWLLVGSPTDERLRHLRDGCRGDRWDSFDYESATDNIKTAYVRRAVEVLIDKGEGLTSDEVRCLRVLSNLSFGGDAAYTGQPMGSPMSFPLLCLVNKTVVDLALTDLLIEGSISFQEWSAHRCLINGDDLLTRSTSSGDLYSAIVSNGARVGLRVNKSKTMQSREWAEINSTAFYDSGSIKEMKKTNVSALWMAAEVTDVLGFAQEATVGGRAFVKVALNNVSRLARCKRKTLGWLEYWRRNLVVGSKKLMAAVVAQPTSSVPDPENLFPTEPMPDGFSLSREEVYDTVTAQVTRFRAHGSWKGLFGSKQALKQRRKAVKISEPEGFVPKRWARQILCPRRPTGDRERVLSCLALRWKKKRKEMLAAKEGSYLDSADVVTFDGESCSPWVQMKRHLKEWKDNTARLPQRHPFEDDPGPCLGGLL